MTENRGIEVLKKMKHMFTETCAKIDENTALDMAIKALEEIQAYRAIRTVEECRVAVERMKPLEPIRNDKCTCPKCGSHNEVIQKRRNTVAFDTVYCWHCGQAIFIERDWSN